MNGIFEHTYFNTYYYSNIITNILSKDIELIGFISNFFADDDILYELAKPFQKFSAFHLFISHIINDFFQYDMAECDKRIYNVYKVNNFPLAQLYAESVSNEYGLNDYSFTDFTDEKKIEYSDIEAYHSELILIGKIEEICLKISHEIFYILFNNREALLKFNNIVADQINLALNDSENNDSHRLFNKKGTLKRCRIPEWCKRAVYFRDRGKCCFCNTDLSGNLSTSYERHYDHIVPLASGGLNDVSNLQLLCGSCNFKKSKHKIITSRYYEAWY